jgi:phosphoribosylformimino-5-aminoimidazole carboxamide ribotide isomerase
MIVIPAIDLLDGRVVRLRGGRREDPTVYDADPVAVARRWAAAGARELHVVDLDAAFGGRRQVGLIARLVAIAGAAVQVGGGVRDAESAEGLLEAGAARVIVGTLAIKQPDVAWALCARHPGRVVVAVDARDGRVAVAGWTEETSVDAAWLARESARNGAARILYTDIARDGAKQGPNVEATARMQEALGATPVIASGGIGGLDDLRALAAAGVGHCVVGKALYDGAFTLEEALAAC